MDEKRTPIPMFDIFNIAWANFDAWAHSPRTLIMMLFVLSECVMLMKGLSQMMATYFMGTQMHLMEMLAFRMSEGCNLAIVSILLLVTINEIPRRISFQNYSMLRSSKKKWLTAQILYCLMMVVCMVFVIIVFMALCAVPYAAPGGGWSDMERIAAGEGDWSQTIVNSFLLKNFSPFQALLFCTIPLILFWFTMMLVILLCGLFGVSVFGVILYAFMLVSHVVFLIDGIGIFRFPSSYATFLNIVRGSEGNEIFRLLTVFGGYAIVIVVLVALMYWRVYHIDFDSYSGNKY